MFPENVVAILKRSGWSEGRSIDASPSLRLLADRGYVVSDCVKEALEEFGGLEIVWQDRYGIPGRWSFHFNVAETIGDIDGNHASFEVLDDARECRHTPIGMDDSINEYIVVDDACRVFVTDGSSWTQIGASIREAINRLCRHAR